MTDCSMIRLDLVWWVSRVAVLGVFFAALPSCFMNVMRLAACAPSVLGRSPCLLHSPSSESTRSVKPAAGGGSVDCSSGLVPGTSDQVHD